MRQANDVVPVVYDVHELSRLLGIPERTIYHHARSGALQTVRVGRRVLFPRGAIDALLRGDAPSPAPAAPAVVSDY